MSALSTHGILRVAGGHGTRSIADGRRAGNLAIPTMHTTTAASFMRRPCRHSVV
jgi:hypothetical protein